MTFIIHNKSIEIPAEDIVATNGAATLDMHVLDILLQAREDNKAEYYKIIARKYISMLKDKYEGYDWVASIPNEWE